MIIEWHGNLKQRFSAICRFAKRLWQILLLGGLCQRFIVFRSSLERRESAPSLRENPKWNGVWRLVLAGHILTLSVMEAEMGLWVKVWNNVVLCFFWVFISHSLVSKVASLSESTPVHACLPKDEFVCELTRFCYLETQIQMGVYSWVWYSCRQEQMK